MRHADEDKSTIETIFRVFHPGQKTYIEFRRSLLRKPGFPMLDRIIRPLLGFDVANMEHVSVLYEGEDLDMFVDELGATNNEGLCPKQINDEATKIYHAYGNSIGKDMTDAGSIHGVAVVVMRKVWH